MLGNANTTCIDWPSSRASHKISLSKQCQNLWLAKFHTYNACKWYESSPMGPGMPSFLTNKTGSSKPPY